MIPPHRPPHAPSFRLVHRSAAMAHVARHIDLIAVSPVPTVLVTGESGTGKGVIARMLHERAGGSARPFVDLNVSTLPDGTVESELFGHERGAFSDAHDRKLGLVEKAAGGTLFLDEIGELSPTAQAKLLTFLERRSFRRVGGTREHHVEVRIVAATNRDLAAMVAARTFREDLYYRLALMTIDVPPLRERRDDILPIAEHVLREASQAYGRRWREFGQVARGVLEAYRWPGNVRELKGVIGRAALVTDGEIMRVQHLPSRLVRDALRGLDEATGREGGLVSLAERKLEHMRRVIEICGGNRALAAQYLGVARQTLARKLKETEVEARRAADAMLCTASDTLH